MAIEQVDLIKTQLRVEGVPQYAADVKQGASALDNFAGSEDRAAQGASSLQTGLQALAALGIATLFEKATRAMVAAASEQETLNKQFVRLTGTVQAAGEKIEWLHKMAREPFGMNMSQVAEAAKTMDIFGLAVGNGEEQLRLFADTARARNVDIEQVMMVMARGKEGMYMARQAMPIGITPSSLKESSYKVEFAGRTPVDTPENLAKIFPAMMEVLMKKYGGMTKEMADTTDTATHRMAMAFDEVKDEMGAGLLPIVNAGADAVTALSDVIKDLDPGLLRTAALFVGVGTAMGGLIAIQKTYQILQSIYISQTRAAVIAIDYEAMARKNSLVQTELASIAKAKETLTYKQATGSSQVFITSMQKEIATQEAAINVTIQKMAMQQKSIAVTEQAALANNTLAASQGRVAATAVGAGAGVGVSMGATAGVAASGAMPAMGAGIAGGFLSKAGSFVRGLKPMAAGLGKAVIPIAVIMELLNTASALNTPETETEYGRLPEKRNMLQDFGAHLLGPVSRFIYEGKETKARQQEMAYFRAQGGETAQQWSADTWNMREEYVPEGAQTKLGNREKLARKTSEELQHAELMNESEEKRAQIIEKQLRLEGLKLKGYDEQEKRARQLGELEQSGYDAIEKKRKTTEETIKELRDKQAEIIASQETRHIADLEKGLVKQKEGLVLSELDAKIKATRNLYERDNIPIIAEQVKGYKDLVTEIDKVISVLGNSKEAQEESKKLEKEKKEAQLAGREGEELMLKLRRESVKLAGEERDALRASASAIKEATTWAGQAGDRAALRGTTRSASMADLEKLGLPDTAGGRLTGLKIDSWALDKDKGNKFFANYLQETADRGQIEKLTGNIAGWQTDIKTAPERPEGKTPEGLKQFIQSREALILDAENSITQITETAEERRWRLGYDYALRRKGLDRGIADATKANIIESLSANLDLALAGRDLDKKLGLPLQGDIANVAAERQKLYNELSARAQKEEPGSPEQARLLIQAAKVWGDALDESLKPVADRFAEKLGGAGAYPAKLTSELQQQAINAPAGLTELLPSQASLNRMKGNNLALRMKPDNSVTVIQLNIEGGSKQEIISRVQQALDDTWYESGNYNVGGIN